MSMETLSNQEEDLVVSELKEIFGWELNELHEKVENKREMVHYSSLTPKELAEVEANRKYKVDFLVDQLRDLTSKRFSAELKENLIRYIIENIFTPDATVNYVWRNKDNKPIIIRNMPVKQFLQKIKNDEIDVSDFTEGRRNLCDFSIRYRSPFLWKDEVNLPDQPFAYGAKLSNIFIFGRNAPHSDDRWSGDGTNENLTK